MSDSPYQYHRASVLMARFNVDLETARKIKAGLVDPAEIVKKPSAKKKTEKDSEVDNG